MTKMLPKIAAGLLLVIVASSIAALWRLVFGLDLQWLCILGGAIWIYLLQLDRINVHDKADEARADTAEARDHAEKASEKSDRAHRAAAAARADADEAITAVQQMYDWLTRNDAEPPTDEIPVVRTDTVDMHQAWETSAAELADRQSARTQVERTVNGHTFRVWEDA